MWYDLVWLRIMQGLGKVNRGQDRSSLVYARFRFCLVYARLVRLWVVRL